MTDAAPCAGCGRLITVPDPRIRSHCERAAHPGQVGCTRYPPRRGSGLQAATGHDGTLPPETAQREGGQRRQRNGSRRRA
jgi:hypothetical protein